MKKNVKLKKWFESMKMAYFRIHLVDRCLMAFMTVLLLQSAYSLFFHGPVSEEIGNIDVIIRTSSAAIFGYFLSANFIRDVPEVEPEKEQEKETDGAFPVNEGEMRSQELVEVAPQKRPHSNRMQIIIASVIGIFCLTVLIILRDMVELGSVAGRSASAAATVAQFRDFVSGCVGFLIGCPTNSGK